MAKVKKVEYEHNGEVYKTQYMIQCEGCGHEHAIALKSDGGNHTFNMNLENPTFSPSLLCNWTPGKKCHSYIKNGRIRYLGDCFHKLKNKTVELKNYD